MKPNKKNELQKAAEKPNAEAIEAEAKEAAETLEQISKRLFEASEALNEAADTIDLTKSQAVSLALEEKINEYREAAKKYEAEAKKAQRWAKDTRQRFAKDA